MNNYTIYNFIQFFSIILLISLFNLSKQAQSITMSLPNSLILLDNSQVVVSSNGIHFFDSSLETEEESKAIPLEIQNTDLLKLAIVQFPREYDGYIIVYIQDTIFIFNSNEKSNIKRQNISETISGTRYNIVPYKKINNNIIFFISYSTTPKFTIANCIFDVTNVISDIIITTNEISLPNYNEIAAQNLLGVPCVLLTPLESLNINNDLLTCFGSIEWEPRIFSATFDPENNFQEIVALRSYAYNSEITHFNYYIYAKTNKRKKKALIYIVFNNIPFWGTFDYTNKFSPIYKEGTNWLNLHPEYYAHKIFYSDQTSEFIIISLFQNCNKFIMIIKNFNLFLKAFFIVMKNAAIQILFYFFLKIMII